VNNASGLVGLVAMQMPQYFHFVLIGELEDDTLAIRRYSLV